MPLIDFNEVEDTNALDLTGFDFTIIGCGAVGIHVALLLTEQAKSVLIIESGMLGEHAERQALNKVTVNRSDMVAARNGDENERLAEQPSDGVGRHSRFANSTSKKGAG